MQLKFKEKNLKLN